MIKEGRKQFSAYFSDEIDKKISEMASQNKTSKAKAIEQIIQFYFDKKDEKEILKAILLRLELLILECQNLDLVGNRTNVFLNHYSENRLNAEDYKKIRADVIEEMKKLKTSKGYDKK